MNTDEFKKFIKASHGNSINEGDSVRRITFVFSNLSTLSISWKKDEEIGTVIVTLFDEETKKCYPYQSDVTEFSFEEAKKILEKKNGTKVGNNSTRGHFTIKT